MRTDKEISKPPFKPPQTYQEQVQVLQDRGIFVPNRGEAVELLQQINYYRLLGYAPYERNKYSETAAQPIPLSRIIRLYQLDHRLRTLFLEIIEPVEIFIKTQFGYYHNQKYGPIGYANYDYFQDRIYHHQFLSKLEDASRKHAKSLLVKNLVNQYKDKYPIWIIVELLSLGMLSKFYKNMLMEDKKKIASLSFRTGPKQLESWLLCLTLLRNRCAHHNRLYRQKFPPNFRLPNKNEYQASGKVFDSLYILQFIFCAKEDWNQSFLPRLRKLLKEFRDDIALEDLGFPADWESKLMETSQNCPQY